MPNFAPAWLFFAGRTLGPAADRAVEKRGIRRGEARGGLPGGVSAGGRAIDNDRTGSDMRSNAVHDFEDITVSRHARHDYLTGFR